MKKQSKLASAFALLALLSQVFVGFAFAQEFGQAPNEVVNLVAVPGNGEVTLTWGETEDPDGVVNEYKVYFGRNSVKTAEAEYEDEVVVGKVLTYTVPNLINETQYFFAVTAIDDEQMESETYSVEASTTPTDPAAKFIKVLNVRQNWDNEIQIELSKDIFFSGDPRTAFVIAEKESSAFMEIKEVQVRENQMIILVVGDFTPQRAYQVIATDQVEDRDGLAIESGVMDRVEFVATRFAEEPEEVPAEEEEIAEEPSEEETEEVGGGAAETEEPEAGGEEEETMVEDARNLSLDTSLLKSEQLILLEWAVAETPNLADQVLYTRRGLEDWDNGYSIGIDITELELEVDLDENYEVMLVSIDSEGNESAGIALSFSTSLSATGPGSIGTVVALMVIFIVGLFFFKKRQTC